jgi:hypothetical protein
MSDLADEKERNTVGSSDDAHNSEGCDFSPLEQRKIVHRVDRRLIVMLGFLHMVSLIDRGNLGTAAVAGMTSELHLVGARYVGAILKKKKGNAYY